MRMYGLIEKKRDGGELDGGEIAWFVKGVTDGSIPDYQISAMLMAIYFRGLTPGETAKLTVEMARSGEMADLSGISGVKADKHSTGGVGDKTTLIVAPIAASCGVRMAKMSGRGLGYTGGTVDKLESIPGFRTALSPAEFVSQVERIGIAVVGQSGNLAPADKKLYALRDVTATVESIPLIASSIMSKKLAGGADRILLDVKVGSGAFMKTREDALTLAREMVSIGEAARRRTAALLTAMDRPLGKQVGNALEVKEAVETLCKSGPEDLTEVCLELAAGILELSFDWEIGRCRDEARRALESGRAFAAFRSMVEAQGGDVRYLDDPSLFQTSPVERKVLSRESGYLASMDAQGIGTASMLLGAGRAAKESAIDPAAGITLLKKPGDRVSLEEPLALFHCKDESLLPEAQRAFLNAVHLSDAPPKRDPLILARVTREGVEPVEEKASV